MSLPNLSDSLIPFSYVGSCHVGIYLGVHVHVYMYRRVSLFDYLCVSATVR